MGKVSHYCMITISYHFDTKHLLRDRIHHSLNEPLHHNMLQTRMATPELVVCWCADSRVIPRRIRSPFDRFVW